MSPKYYANIMRILCEAWVWCDLAPHLWFAGVTQTRVSHHDANMELNKPLEFRTLLWYPGVIRMHAKHHPQEEHVLRMQLYVRYCLEWWAVLWRSKNCRLCEQRNIQIGNMQCIINMINEMTHAKLHFGYCQELGKVMLVCVFCIIRTEYNTNIANGCRNH